jgi:hypothetical protein
VVDASSKTYLDNGIFDCDVTCHTETTIQPNEILWSGYIGGLNSWIGQFEKSLGAVLDSALDRVKQRLSKSNQFHFPGTGAYSFTNPMFTKWGG